MPVYRPELSSEHIVTLPLDNIAITTAHVLLVYGLSRVGHHQISGSPYQLVHWRDGNKNETISVQYSVSDISQKNRTDSYVGGLGPANLATQDGCKVTLFVFRLLSETDSHTPQDGFSQASWILALSNSVPESSSFTRTT